MTQKQKLVAENLSENVGKPIGQAMLESGYSESTSKTPARLTKSKSWQRLMQKHLPDALLAKKHEELLKVPKKVRTYVKGDLTSEVEEIDTHAVSKGLDLAYKLKGRYQNEKSDSDTNIAVVNVIKFDKDYKKQIEAEVVE